MENALNMILSAENVRTLVTIVSIIAWGTIYIKKLEFKMELSIKELEHKTESSIKELKYNDFAHLGSAFKALTYVLEKNESISKADKEFIDSSLQGDA